jgi:hypothetical protein
VGPGKDLFGWPTADVSTRRPLACVSSVGRCIPWPRPTGVAASGTVAEAWSVCSYAPSACHTNNCEL